MAVRPPRQLLAAGVVVLVASFGGATGCSSGGDPGAALAEHLPLPDPGVLPLVLFTTTQHGTIARRALSIGPNGKFVVPAK